MNRHQYQRYLQGNNLSDNNKIDLDRIIGAITGDQDPLNFPISYPAIDFDPKTKQTIINSALIIGFSIIIAGAVRGATTRSR